MSLVALKFVLAALIVMIIVVVMWLVAELREGPAEVRLLVGWVLAAGISIALAALLAALAGGLSVVLPGWLS